MPETNAADDDRLWPALFDRLRDKDDQATGIDLRTERPRALAHLRDAVQRELEWLLNSKQPLVRGKLEGEVSKSLLTYGLPDLSSLSLSDPRDKDRLARAIREAVTRGEPRLRDVEVEVFDPRADERALRFRIAARLVVGQVAEPVAFGTVLQLATKRFEVRSE